MAALVVVSSHARGLFFRSFTAPSQTGVGLSRSHINIGLEAVMIFFVLSGFLVGGSVIKNARNGDWSWSDYLLRRLTRLWVVLVPAILFGYMLDHIGIRFFSQPGGIYTAPPGQQMVFDLLPTLRPSVLLGNLFFLQDALVPTLGTNRSLWSLTNEFWYYLAFPILYLAFFVKRTYIARAFALVACVLIYLVVGPDISWLFLVWLLGALVYRIPKTLSQKAVSFLAPFLLAILLVSSPLIRRSNLSGHADEALISIIFAALLYTLKHKTELARPNAYSRSAGLLSRISYTLYLFHLPLAVFLCACLNHPWHVYPTTLTNIVGLAAFTAVLIAFSYLFYLLFEARTDAVRDFISSLSVKLSSQPPPRLNLNVPELGVRPRSSFEDMDPSFGRLTTHHSRHTIIGRRFLTRQ
jgi:peptidoglycan/LPS O-acetylase OafA/YrhL